MRKMKANIVPLRFRDADEKEFYRILDALKEIYQEEVMRSGNPWKQHFLFCEM